MVADGKCRRRIRQMEMVKGGSWQVEWVEGG